MEVRIISETEGGRNQKQSQAEETVDLDRQVPLLLLITAPIIAITIFTCGYFILETIHKQSTLVESPATYDPQFLVSVGPDDTRWDPAMPINDSNRLDEDEAYMSHLIKDLPFTSLSCGMSFRRNLNLNDILSMTAELNESTTSDRVDNATRPLLQAEAPWHLTLFLSLEGRLDLLCSSVLLTHHYALTASPCIPAGLQHHLWVVAGYLLKRQMIQALKDKESDNVRHVTHLWIHPNAKQGSGLALLRWHRPYRLLVTYPDSLVILTPICLPSERIVKSYDRSMVSTHFVTGLSDMVTFNDNNYRLKPNQFSGLQVSTLAYQMNTILGNDRCYSSTRSKILAFCGDKQQMCKGDEGSPLVSSLLDPSQSKGRHFLTGIAIKRYPIEGSSCLDMKASLFINVIPHVEWIADTIVASKKRANEEFVDVFTAIDDRKFKQDEDESNVVLQLIKSSGLFVDLVTPDMAEFKHPSSESTSDEDNFTAKILEEYRFASSSCGYQNRIVGDTEPYIMEENNSSAVAAGQVPWHLSLYRMFPSRFTGFEHYSESDVDYTLYRIPKCSASLLASQYGITAAHCVLDDTGQMISHVFVVAGYIVAEQAELSFNRHTSRRVLQALAHPSWRSDPPKETEFWEMMDLAVVRWAKPLKRLHDTNGIILVSPICLVSQSILDSYNLTLYNSSQLVSGIVDTDHEESSLSVLSFSNVTIEPASSFHAKDSYCASNYPGFIPTCQFNTNETCISNSGSPLVTSLPQSYPKRYVQVGMMSHSFTEPLGETPEAPDEEGSSCEDRKVEFYLDIRTVSSWINETIITMAELFDDSLNDIYS